MNSFPLTPFLTALATDGIAVTLHDYDRISLVLRTQGPWTVARLRGVLMALLVHDAEHEAAFLRCFNTFFDAELNAEALFSQIDVESALTDLRHLAQQKVTEGETTRPPRRFIRAVEVEVSERPQTKWFWLALVLALLLICAGGGYVWRSGWKPPVEPRILHKTPDAQSVCSPPTFPSDLSWPKSIKEPLPIVTPDDYQRLLLAAAGLLLLTLGYGFYLWRSRQVPKDKPPTFRPELPRHFRLSAVGGHAAPRLDGEALDQLADTLGYFQSEQPSDVLDVVASIEATGNNGGLPQLVFQSRRVIRTVIILEDAAAGGESLESNRPRIG